MKKSYKIFYGIELVFCIDASSGTEVVFSAVKNYALNFYKDFHDLMEKRLKPIDKERVKVVF